MFLLFFVALELKDFFATLESLEFIFASLELQEFIFATSVSNKMFLIG